MTDADIFSWILLCLSAEGSTRRQISEMADAINHAIPTHQEMETSLRWLQETGLVREDGCRFALTEAGATLHQRHRSPTRPIMAAWNLLSHEVELLLKKGQNDG